tara:strand:+ start:1938 stop:2348 length:411 start_codon:yes stop_codon:yes gene_type:complete
MLKIFTIFLFLFTCNFSNSYIINNFKTNKISNKKPIKLLMINSCPDYLNKYTNLLSKEQGEIIVKQISGLFPKMDIISHYVLHTNDILINYVLNNNHINVETKKSLALFLIEMTQKGDSTGSHILQIYHDLVNCLL